MKKEPKLEDKYYLINHENYHEFHEDDIIIYEIPYVFNGDLEAKVFKDERGIYILKENNHLDSCTNYIVKKYFEEGTNIEYDIKVIISNLKVDFFYFSFNYEIFVNTLKYDDGLYESDHAWQDDREGFYNLLKNGHAITSILNDLNIKNNNEES